MTDKLSDGTLARVAEFLTLTTLLDGASPELYVRVNALSFHLCMELPAGLWRAVIHATTSELGVAACYAAIDAIRDHQGLDGQFTATDFFWAAPNINKPK